MGKSAFKAGRIGLIRNPDEMPPEDRKLIVNPNGDRHAYSVRDDGLKPGSLIVELTTDLMVSGDKNKTGQCRLATDPPDAKIVRVSAGFFRRIFVEP